MIDKVSGIVTVNGKILSSLSTGSFSVVAIDGGGLQSKYDVQYKINDVNDHSPVFSHPVNEVIHINEVY